MQALLAKKPIRNQELIRNFNIGRGGTRLRIIRHLLKLNRPTFADSCGLTPTRIKGLEDLTQKMNEDDIFAVSDSFPFCTDYLVTGSELRLDPTAEIIRSKANDLLIDKPDLLAQANKIKEISDTDMVRAALVIPEFRKLLTKALKVEIAAAIQEAKKDGR